MNRLPTLEETRIRTLAVDRACSCPHFCTASREWPHLPCTRFWCWPIAGSGLRDLSRPGSRGAPGTEPSGAEPGQASGEVPERDLQAPVEPDRIQRGLTWPGYASTYRAIPPALP